MSLSCPVPECLSTISAQYPSRLQRHCVEVHANDLVSTQCPSLTCRQVFSGVPALEFVNHYCNHLRYRDDGSEDIDDRIPQDDALDEYWQMQDQRMNAEGDLPAWLFEMLAGPDDATPEDACHHDLPVIEEDTRVELDFLLFEIRNSLTTKSSPSPL